jgi:SnoaL-like protein
MIRPGLTVYALTALTLAACGRSPSAPSAQDAAALAALQTRIAALEHRKTLVADSIEIERLQAAFGYYFDKALWDDVANLFADDGTIELALDGVYVGKARVREYLEALGGGREGPREGHLDEHLQVMPVVTLAADGQTAKARWRGIVLEGDYGGDAHWGEGPYENEYVKQNGVWKIKTLHWYQALFVPYAGGWQTNPDPTMGTLASGVTPDRPPSVDYKTWPETYLPPFSFPNPVAKYVPASAAGGSQ